MKVTKFLCASVIESNRNLDAVSSQLLLSCFLFFLKHAYCAIEDRRDLSDLELESDCIEIA